MNFYVLTLFPEMIDQTMNTSIMGRALENGRINLTLINIRDFSGNKHNRVDDYPYGGGAGMVMQAGPVYGAYRKAVSECGQGQTKVIYLTPQGGVFDQKMAAELAGADNLIFVCGHYEGVDERVLEKMNPIPVSIGDYVLTGGELPALVMMDAIARLEPGVLNNDVSAETESFSGHMLEYPQYTRPETWEGLQVPDVLLTGHHKNIDRWRMEESLKRTLERRPDLLAWREKEADTRSGFYRQEISDSLFEKIYGISYKENCTVPRTDLCYLHVLHIGFDYGIHGGELIANKKISDDLLDIFRKLYEVRYPIEKIRLVEEYNAQDEASMADNNSSCFNYRTISASSRLSLHGFGMAVDINPLYNPYIKRINGKLTCEPSEGWAYADRGKNFEYKITEEDVCCRIFRLHGFTWGGSWKGSKDYQHFEKTLA